MKIPVEVERCRGFNPVLIVFAPASSHPAYVAAREQLRATRNTLNSWDIEVFTVFGHEPAFQGMDRITTPAADFRRDFRANRHEFTAVFLGLEGDEWLRQSGELDLAAIFDELTLRRGRAHLASTKSSGALRQG